MLYVFHVDTGTMMTFDMNLALESVSHLQNVIDNTWRIARDKQVLLVSGGESLDPNARVCSYSAGTDTNPIYLFSKSVIESTNPPTPNIDCGTDFGLKEQVDASLELPATYNTVVARAQLAQLFCEQAREQTKMCEKLVHEQHLQQQGWAAVVANLEDITMEFKVRSEKFQQSFNQYLEMRVSYLEFLQNFNNDLTTLSKIPMLPALSVEPQMCIEPRVCARTLSNSVDKCDLSNEDDEKCDKVLTLLQWISAADNQSSLDLVAEQCSRGLQQLDAAAIESLCNEVKTALDAANNSQMKEVKGLGDRLYRLEQLMCESKRYVQEQSDLAQAFLQNQNRASNLGDLSILPDLCASHLRQLLVMLDNHQKLGDIRRRCTRAKEELIVNLYHRLKWIMYVENLILETDHKLMIYHESLKRLRRHVEIIQQIHLAPAMYLNAVAEVVRRRAFSQAFLLWASELACHILTIHNDEVTRRKDFQAQFEGHFLNSLFPGMDDLPPSFATQAPSIFDSSLPKLTSEDIERLKTELPELTQNISVPDVSAITQFFLQKSLAKDDKVDERNVEEKLVQAVLDVGLASNLDRGLLKPIESENFLSTHAALPHLKDFDKGFESETDTEEFEKVGQSPLELQFDVKTTTSPRPGTNDASTLTEVGQISTVPPKKPPRAFLKSINSKTSSLDSNQSSVLTQNQSLSILFEDEVGGQDAQSDDTDSTLKSKSVEPEAGFVVPTKKSSSVTSPHLPSRSFHPGSMSPCSPCSSQGHPQVVEFVSDEFYIDESMPSSLSIEGTTQSQGELGRQLEQANNVIALFQENLSTSKMESEKLKSFVLQMAALAKETMAQLRIELDDLRTQVMAEQSMISTHCMSVSGSWDKVIVECEVKEREALQRLTVDHELEQSDLKKLIQCKGEEIQSLRKENQCLEKSLEMLKGESRMQKDEYERLLQQSMNDCMDLKKRIEAFAEEKEKAVKETRDNLTKEYKAEMESIRSRFKLMSFMERSPSDSSLEKIDHNTIDIVKHNALLRQLKDDLCLEKEKAVNDAVAEERARWEARLEQELTQSKIRNEAEKQVQFNEAMRRVVEEKCSQIDLLKQREAMLSSDCMKYQQTIQRLMEQDSEGARISLMNELEKLKNEKCQLEQDLYKEMRSNSTDQVLCASVSVCEGKADACTSPVMMCEKLTSSQRNMIQDGKINIASSNVGDPVLVIWESVYQNYMILQESNILHFLHPESLEKLNLRAQTSNDTNRKPYLIGIVVDREYCYARKVGNRYRVPKGTKFYRVKVKQFLKLKDSVCSQQHQQHQQNQQQSSSQAASTLMTQSQSSEQSTSVVCTSDMAESQSVPTSPVKTDSCASTSNTLSLVHPD